uniref:Uncharacterized protein n=1 Tax=Ixodes ricinus TaxID=34613 RepID=A0A6B0U396_IXORI
MSPPLIGVVGVGGSCAALGGNSPFLIRISKTSSTSLLLTDRDRPGLEVACVTVVGGNGCACLALFSCLVASS